MDRRHKLVRRYQVTDAAVHDSQVVDDILDPDNHALGLDPGDGLGGVGGQRLPVGGACPRA